MKKFLVYLLSAMFCAALIFARFSVKVPGNADDNGKDGETVIYIDYKNYTRFELNSVKAMLETRMSEFGIITLGIGSDWVSIRVYELTDELENFLVTQIFPEYKSSVVRIELLPEDTEIRFA